MSSEMMKWPYLPVLGSFRDEMNKLFENFTRRGAAAGMDLVPPLDISETEENILVKVEVPGVEPKDIDISISGDTLTIKGEKNPKRKRREEIITLWKGAAGVFQVCRVTGIGKIRTGKS